MTPQDVGLAAIWLSRTNNKSLYEPVIRNHGVTWERWKKWSELPTNETIDQDVLNGIGYKAD